MRGDVRGDIHCLIIWCSCGDPPGLHHVAPAVDIDAHPVDVAGVVGGKEGDDGGHLDRIGQAAQGERAQDAFLLFGGPALPLGLHPGGEDNARGHAVGADTEGTQLDRHVLGEPNDTRLGGAVLGPGDQAEVAPGEGRDVDDAAVLLGLHDRSGGADAEKSGLEVESDGAVPVCGVDGLHGLRGRAESRIVDEDDPAAPRCLRPASPRTQPAPDPARCTARQAPARRQR